MNGNTLYNVPDPVNPQDVATKEYADNIRGGRWFQRKQDGTYTIKRDLDMNNKRLKNVSPLVEDTDAVNKIYADTLSDETKRYVDSVTPFVNQQYEYIATKEYVDKRPHIIAVHPNYYGPLRDGEYQFAFGGSTIDPNGSSGFLVPQTGRIKKKIQVKIDLEWEYYRFRNTYL